MPINNLKVLTASSSTELATKIQAELPAWQPLGPIQYESVGQPGFMITMVQGQAVDIDAITSKLDDLGTWFEDTLKAQVDAIKAANTAPVAGVTTGTDAIEASYTTFTDLAEQVRAAVNQLYRG